MKRISLIFALVIVSVLTQAQMLNPTKWEFDSKQNGREAELIFKATMEEGWHVYDISLPEGGPIATTISYDDSTLFRFVGDILKSKEPVTVFDENFNLNVSYFGEEVTFTQKIELLSDEPVTISGNVLFMSCNDENCTPPENAEFKFKFNQGNQVAAQDKADTSSEDIAFVAASDGGQTLWLFILVSVLAGLAAVLTPCVFPMIPMTVSFFMRGSEDRGKSIRTGIFFGFSIIMIFTLLGALFSFGVFGPNAGSILSTHWIPNLLFFLLFLVFAISFFGAFEIVLPSSLVNKTDSKADKGGMIGAFFMALTTVIVSFSCTGPFIGALIIQAVQSGGMRPLVGMFFFGLAFATPFTLLAIFPSALSKLPKSGAWLNSIKVVFAFILLAFGLKFLSNIDQVYGLNLLSREIYLAIWIVIFFMLGLYFLGKIKFSHDSDLPYVGIGRLFLSIATFTFVIYLFTGLLGNNLASISSLIPPESQGSWMGAAKPSAAARISEPQELCGPAKYSDKLHLPNGLQGYFDYEQGIACAKEQGKPAFIVFKGHACSNCKKMENTVWKNERVMKLLSEQFVVVGLYTDDRTKLGKDEQFTSEVNGKNISTLGGKNLDWQIKNYKTNSIPFHVIIKPDGTQETLGVTFNDEEFLAFIEKGLQ